MGVLFDMDGVLIDSNAAHFESWKVVAAEEGVVFPQEIFWRTYGMTSVEIVRDFWEGGPRTPEQIDRIVDRKEEIFRNDIKKNVVPIPGAVEFVRYLSERGVKIAVGSSAPRANVDYILSWLGIRELFGGIVAGDEIENGKPAPDIYLAAAKKIGENAQNCVVVDDARSGVNAGKNAGATTIGFFSGGHSPDEYANADCVVRTFDELKNLLAIDENGAVRTLFGA